MVKYHVSSKTGEMNRCRADKIECPLDSAQHFENMKEAYSFSEEVLERSFSSVSSLSSTNHSSLISTWRNSLSDDERDAWESYGSFEHGEINDALRRDDVGSLSDDQRKVIDNMDKALARCPRRKSNHTLFRGVKTANSDLPRKTDMNPVEWVKKNIGEAGNEVVFNEFVSTSTSEDISHEFSGMNAPDYISGVLMKIDTTQSAKWNEDGSYEEEVTLARGTKFRVISVDMDHKVKGYSRPLIHLEEISQYDR